MKGKPTVTEVIDDLLNGLNDLKNDVNGDGEVTIEDVMALIEQCLNGDQDEEDNHVFDVNGVSFKMKPVKPGTFTMGSPNTEMGRGTNEGPQHEVTISKEYWIAETQVTQELWEAVMGSNPSYFKGDPQRPVEQVTWNDCQAFIAKLNELTGKKFRLPTEAEWEFAAKGGTLSHGTMFPGCASPLQGGKPKEFIWYTSNSDGTTHPVKQKKPNELGLYDMGGNVAEWVNDFYSAYSSAPVTDPTGPASGSFRVYRNGSYVDAVSNCRCCYRYPAQPTYKKTFIGLRLAL